jgi:hypothetical protein
LVSTLANLNGAPVVIAQDGDSYGTGGVFASTPNSLVQQQIGGGASYGAQLLNYGTQSTNMTFGLKGKQIFEMPFVDCHLATTGIISLFDSNPQKTFADVSHNPPWDANDLTIGMDQGASGCASTASLFFHSPTTTHFYNGVLPNATGSNYQFGIGPQIAGFNVPVAFADTIAAFGGCSGCGPFTISGTQVADNFNRANGSLGANWTTVLGGIGINNDTAVVTSLTVPVSGYCDAAGTNGCAQVYYSGATFSSDQQIQWTSTNNSTGTNAFGGCVRVQCGSSLSGYCV